MSIKSLETKEIMAQKFSKFSAEDLLIPGLPNEVSDLCLLRLPFPSPVLLRCVSSSWNRTLSNPSFFTTKFSLSLAKPYLLVLVRDQIDRKIQWLCLDPVSKSWCRLPPLPITDAESVEPATVASSVAKEKGEMYFFRGGSKYSVMVYSVATNSWRIGNDSMEPGGYFFTSATIGGKAFAFASDDNSDDWTTRVLCYDPALDSLVDLARATCDFARNYDAAVIGTKVYVTEGWGWPFETVDGGSVYDTEVNKWENMPLGMCEGWTGSAVTLGSNLFMLKETSETSNRNVKVYDHVTDSWLQVKGSGIPELLKFPFEFAAADETGKIYVVGRELDVAIATLIEVERKKWEVEWDVVKGPDAFSHFFPRNSQILYA